MPHQGLCYWASNGKFALILRDSCCRNGPPTRRLLCDAALEAIVPYDAVIIGAGMSGLAAGIRLAYFEKSVCILERHTTIGGLNSFYRLRGRNHDVGLHAVTNYAPPGAKAGPLSKVLRQLRLRWEDFGLSPQCFST